MHECCQGVELHNEGRPYRCRCLHSRRTGIVRAHGLRNAITRIEMVELKPDLNHWINALQMY
jgi:hypothetical protein